MRFQNCSFLLTRKAALVAPDLTWKKKDSRRCLKMPTHLNATMRARAAPSRARTTNFPMIRVPSGQERERTPLGGQKAEGGASRFMALLSDWCQPKTVSCQGAAAAVLLRPLPSPPRPAPPRPPLHVQGHLYVGYSKLP